MIQRIQSVYWLVVSVLSTLLLMTPLAGFSNQKMSLVFQIASVTNQADGSVFYSVWPLLVLNILIIVLSVVSILKYKNRKLQIKLSLANMALLLAFYVLFFVYAEVIKSASGLQLTWNFAIVFPLVSVVMNWLAMRAVKADEALIKSLDRIR